MDYNYFHSKINQLQDLKDASDVKSESIDLAVRLDDLKSLSKKLYDAKKEFELLGELSGSPLSENQFFVNLQSDVNKIKTRFDTAPTSQSITTGRSFTNVTELVNDAKNYLEDEFKQYRKKLYEENFRIFERPSDLEAKLVMTPENKKNLDIYKPLFSEVDKIFNETSVSSFKEKLEKIEELSKKLNGIRSKFSEDYPDFVNNFFVQVGQGRGVDLESISVELLEWLNHNSLSKNYRVSRKNDPA